jgi:hypothetical protein
MKNYISKLAVLGTLLLMSGEAMHSQGFVNLDFESAQIIPVIGGGSPSDITTANALPGWTVYYGSAQVTQISYNAPAGGSTWVNLWATNGEQISGNYSVLLQGGLTASAASISQTALVPALTESLLFEANQARGAGTLQVLLDGQDLTLFALATGANYTLYGADISPYAGLTETLEFSALEVSGSNFANDWNIDNIQFSPSAVPEPGSFGLSALGGLFLALRCWRKSSQIQIPTNRWSQTAATGFLQRFLTRA